jgi:hypothetical protein
MGDATITTASTLQCPHGGTVQISSSNTRAKAGAAIALVSDTATISGCPFQIPAVVPIPSPCIMVMWVKPDVRVKVGGQPTLSHGSVGLCIGATGAPQGPVQKVNSQLHAKSS